LVIGELRLTDKFVQSDGASLYNLLQVRPALVFDESKMSPFLKSFELAYAFSTYNFVPTGTSGKDQKRHSLFVNQAFSLCKSYGTQLDISYVHAWNNARGDDYDFEQDSAVAQLQTNFGAEPSNGQKSFLHKLSLEVSVKYNFDRYSKLHSRTAFLARRSDDYCQVIAVLAYSINKNLDLTTSYTYSDDASNIPVYHYHGHSVLSGVSVNF
jgi:hypothetical protein